MENYLIQPWGSNDSQISTNLDTLVPKEVDELAQQVITHYDMDAQVKTLIASKPNKGGAIWKIKTNQGPRSLKILHRTPIRSLFSIGAQNYIVKQGGRVPEIKKTKQGTFYVEKGGKLWIVTDWIESLTPVSKDPAGAQTLCYGLGEFHRHSRGYIPPERSQKSSRLYHWPASYQRKIKKIDWFRNVAKAYNDIPCCLSLQSFLDIYQRQALNALSCLEQSSYAQLASLGEEHWGLVHQDYGWSGGQLGPGGLWIIDLDKAAYDLPIRDLRKLISGTMDDLGSWDAAWIRDMIGAYHQANPLNLQTYEILINDLSFPNEFYNLLNELLYDPVNFINKDLERIIQHLTHLEKTKELALADLQLDKHKFLTGNYALNPDVKTVTLPSWILKKNFSSDLNKIEDGFQLEKDLLPLKIIAPVKYETLPEHNCVPKSAQPEKLKVLMICTEQLSAPSVGDGAIPTYIQVVSGILSQEHDLTILGTTDSSSPLEECQDNIHYVKIPCEQVLEIYAKKVISFLQNNCFDLIQVFNQPRLIHLIREVAPQAKIILSMHNDLFSPDKIHPLDALVTINDVERIITVSDDIGKAISSLYPQASSKVRTIYPGVDLATFIPWKNSSTAAQIRWKLREEYGLESKTVVLFVGRLTPEKGTDLLIQALNEAYPSVSNIALVIVGKNRYSLDSATDYEAYIHALAEKAFFSVIMIDCVSAELIHQWFWAGDILVCPSQEQEPLAHVHFEAMAAGLPFVTTARGGNPEVVSEQNGLIVEQPEDPLEFAEKLKILLTDPKLREKMGQTGRRLAETRFSWKRVAHEVSEVWKSHFAPEETVEEKNCLSELSNDQTKTENIESALGGGSSVVKVTRDMIVSMRIIDHPFTRNTVFPIRVNIDELDIYSSSVVKVTRDMIVQ